ncbi:MAG TPA: gluconokinase, partial [Streptomyces sp.]
EDRRPWLVALAAWIKEATVSGRGGVMACSALKYAYRDLFRQAGPGVWFLHLTLDPAVADGRVAGRSGHFMPARLVDSQYRALEPLRSDEPGLTLDATGAPQTIVDTACEAVQALG